VNFHAISKNIFLEDQAHHVFGHDSWRAREDNRRRARAETGQEACSKSAVSALHPREQLVKIQQLERRLSLLQAQKQSRSTEEVEALNAQLLRENEELRDTLQVMRKKLLSIGSMATSAAGQSPIHYDGYLQMLRITLFQTISCAKPQLNCLLPVRALEHFQINMVLYMELQSVGFIIMSKKPLQVICCLLNLN
jgi:hypothetical protein